MKNWNTVGKTLLALSLIGMGSLSAGGVKCTPKKKADPCVELRDYERFECYSPQYYDLKCATGFFVTGDFLYWYARESNLDVGHLCTFIIQPVSAADQPNPFAVGAIPEIRIFGMPTKHLYVEGDWKPGFRVGFGWNMDHDGWDLYTNYTYFHSHGSKSKNIPFGVADPNSTAETTAFIRAGGWEQTFDPWGNALGTITPFALLQEPGLPPDSSSRYYLAGNNISGKWSLYFNQIDLELGRKYWVSKFLNLRPYVGIRGAKVHTNFVVKQIDEEEFTIPITVAGMGGAQSTISILPGIHNIFKNKFSNKYWGVGLMGGLQPEFHFCKNIMLYGNVDGALLWGKHHTKNRVQLNGDTPFSINGTRFDFVTAASVTESDYVTRMQGILDLALGIRWEEHWADDRYSTSLDLGWEHHYWFDFGLYHRVSGTNFDSTGTIAQGGSGAIIDCNQSFNNITTNLGFGGFVLRARFDF